MPSDSSKHQLPPAKSDSKALKKKLEPLASTDLLQGQRERQIVHGNEVYRLTLTRTGKLILHK